MEPSVNSADTAGSVGKARRQFRDSTRDRDPRYVRRILGVCQLARLEIDGGWIAAPVEWFDRYHRTTFNREEMEQSINAACKHFDRDNDSFKAVGVTPS